MGNTHFLTKDLIAASEEIQKHLKENDIDYISLSDARVLLNKKGIKVNVAKYLNSVKSKDKTQISGAVNHWINKWRIYRNVNITKNEVQLSSYQMLVDFAWQRLCKSKKSFAFMSYFIVITIIVGLLTAFLGSLKYLNNDFDTNSFNISLIGYSVVLSCSATIDFLFMSFDNEEQIRYNSHSTSIKMLGFTSFITIILLSFLSYLIANFFLKIFITCLLTLISIMLWWIANAKTGKLIAEEENMTKPNQSQSSGGDVNRSLNGSIPNDFKVK